VTTTPAAPAALDARALKLDWCTHEAARYAVTHWHYSHSLPTPPIVKIGVWEGGAFIGCVLYSRGASADLGTPYGLATTDVCELARVALKAHSAPVSRVVAISLRFLVRHCPGLRLVISFADPNFGHHGGIYQAGNWLYLGATPPSVSYVDPTGRKWHGRQVSKSGVNTQYGAARQVPRTQDCARVDERGKFRYAMPLDDAMRAQLAPLVQPYPKRAGSIVSEHDAPSSPARRGRGGSDPGAPRIARS
jgi:hypothetical protein